MRFASLVRGLFSASLVLAGCFGGDDRPTLRLGTDIPDHGKTLSSALFQNVGVEMTGGHRVEILDNGVVFDAIVGDIGRAETSVHVVVYIWDEGRASERVSEAIVRRAHDGVQCRVLVDAFGSPDFEDDVAPELRRAGCDVRMFRPDEKLARDHRKIVVIDGRVAYTGGFGIADEWLGDGLDEDHWRDEAVRFVGPAVRDAQQAFAENWLESGGALLPLDAFPPAKRHAGSARAAFVTSTASPKLTRAERLVQMLIATASHRLWIANAYFVPSEGIVELLLRKADAGVDVRVLTAGMKTDSKASLAGQHIEYDELLEHGVRIWEYGPAMMHAKTMVVDDQLTMVGSINLEPLSLRELEEGALVIEDRATNAHLARTFLADCEHAGEQ